MARSTAPGRAAVAVVRLSGPDAIRIADATLRAAHPLSGRRGHSLTHGVITTSRGEVIDEVVVCLFRAPRSYTGENVVEISCHGTPVVVSALVARLEEAGARPAAPGEFTRRAFLNGKLDLAQAEAVARLIETRALAGARGAARELTGGLSRRVGALRHAVLGTLAEIEAHVDFPDEDLAGVERGALAEALERHAEQTEALYRGARRARAASAVATVAIVGAPNAGKSSLFNALVGRDRSIVHDLPGTTRDVVDAEVVLGEQAVRLTDTAGMGEGTSAVEAEGIRRSREAHAAADRVLVVVDGSRPETTGPERALLAACDPERTLVVVSKGDLPRRLPVSTLSGWEPIVASVVSGEGLEALERALSASVLGDDPGGGAQGGAEDDIGAAMGGGERVGRAIEAAATAAGRAREVFCATGALELVAEELRETANTLGAVTGERVGADVLDVIFSRFCIGK